MLVDVDARIAQEAIGRCERFADPFAEPAGYAIVEVEEGADLGPLMERYKSRLRYAAANADALIAGAFRREFYDFYGVDRGRVTSPEEMCRGLRFDSFVLDMRNGWVEACLSNDSFLFGHYIECWWDDRWQVVFLDIC